MTLETNNNCLTVEAVNAVLEGDWLAYRNPSGFYNGALAEHGFELFQGQRGPDGEMVCTTDSLPVLRARQVGNRIQLTLLDESHLDLHELGA